MSLRNVASVSEVFHKHFIRNPAISPHVVGLGALRLALLPVYLERTTVQARDLINTSALIVVGGAYMTLQRGTQVMGCPVLCSAPGIGYSRMKQEYSMFLTPSNLASEIIELFPLLL